MSPYTLNVLGFTRGKRVRVIHQNKYNTERPDGELGVVHAAYGTNIAVKMDNMKNARSAGGWYYFTPNELELVDDLNYVSYINNDIWQTLQASERYAFGTGKYKEEYVETMKLEDVKVVVNGKFYPARDVNWIQTPGDYPRLEVGAYMDPGKSSRVDYNKIHSTPKPVSIKNVIFNPPATIVFWTDNTKTVVKCDQELYDPEKGIAMAISKKLLGENKYEYYNVFRHWLKKWDKQYSETTAESEDFNGRNHVVRLTDEELNYLNGMYGL